MERLFFFSDHRIPENRALDDRVLEIAGTRSPSVAWIPAGGHPEKISQFFSDRRQYYAKLGVADVEQFSLHDNFNEARVPWLLKRNIIHLSGGDPFIFLQNLKRTGMTEILKQWASDGGILVGDSAGAMLMSANIKVTRFGHIPCPASMADLSALGLVDFEVHPHFGSYGASAEELRAYSLANKITIYGIPDGGGIAVLNGKMEFYGTVVRFKNGQDVTEPCAL